MATTAPQTNNSRGPRPAGGPNSGGPRRGGPRRDDRRPSFDRPKPEFDQKIIAIRRVTRVVAGGRRMSFAVAMVIGDKKGSVGVGTGKATDTALAITKAVKNAKKTLITIKTTKTGSIPHDVAGKYASSYLMMMPNRGKGMIAGSAIRDILILAGIKDVTAKIHSGSKNKLNIARAAMVALGAVSSPRRPRAEEPKAQVTEEAKEVAK